MTKISLINGVFSNKVSVFERGLAYGDGLFETMTWQNFNSDEYPNQVEFWTRHLQRIFIGCRTLSIKPPNSKILNNYKNKILKKANILGLNKGILKIIISRGIGGRGYKYDKDIKPTIIFLAFPFSKYPEKFYKKGVSVRFCDSRLSSNENLVGLKHLNRLDSVLARAEWSNQKIFEGLFCDDKENIIEGTMTNIFLVRKNTLYTPEIKESGINGIMRQVIIENYKNFFDQIKITKIRRGNIREFQQIFLTNSVLKIMPVAKIEENKFSVLGKIKEIIDYYELQENLEFN